MITCAVLKKSVLMSVLVLATIIASAPEALAQRADKTKAASEVVRSDKKIGKAVEASPQEVRSQMLHPALATANSNAEAYRLSSFRSVSFREDAAVQKQDGSNTWWYVASVVALSAGFFGAAVLLAGSDNGNRNANELPLPPDRP